MLNVLIFLDLEGFEISCLVEDENFVTSGLG